MLKSRVSRKNMLDHIIFSSCPQINSRSFSIHPLFSRASLEIQVFPRATKLRLPYKSHRQPTQSERASEQRMPILTSTSSFLNSPTLSTHSKVCNPSSISAISRFRTALNLQRGRTRAISCNVALNQDSATASTSSSQESEASPARIGAKVKVKVPLKVYHVPKVPETDLFHMEGRIKDYVGVWKGKRISANLPFKVEFLANVEGRDQPVKFFAHLKEDEFDYLD